MHLGGDAVRRLAAEIATSHDPVTIAKLACTAAARVAHSCSISYAANGRPQITIDNHAATDRARIAYLETDWRRDGLLRAMLACHGPVDDGGTLLLPIVQPTNIIGALRCALPGDRRVERDVIAVAMLVSARLSELGGILNDAPVLTKRQLEIAELAALGMTTSAIGDALKVSPNTIKRHLKEVFVRLRINSRFELVHALRGVRFIDVPHGITRDGNLTIARRPPRNEEDHVPIQPRACCSTGCVGDRAEQLDQFHA